MASDLVAELTYNIGFCWKNNLTIVIKLSGNAIFYSRSRK